MFILSLHLIQIFICRIKYWSSPYVCDDFVWITLWLKTFKMYSIHNIYIHMTLCSYHTCQFAHLFLHVYIKRQSFSMRCMDSKSYRADCWVQAFMKRVNQNTQNSTCILCKLYSTVTGKYDFTKPFLISWK